MQKPSIPSRFYLLKFLGLTYLLLAVVVRIILYAISFHELDFSLFKLLQIFGLGLFFDLGSLSYILSFFAGYLLLLPVQFHGSRLDRFLCYFFYFVSVFCLVFAALGEITFWQEYQRRFNFIAVDYLLYTYEVVQNIHQSYPLPLLLSGILLATFFSIRVAKKKNAFQKTFDSKSRFLKKAFPTLTLILFLLAYHTSIENKAAEIFENRFENELAKSGVYSFFAAYKSNELSYDEFYAQIPRDAAFKKTKENLSKQGDSLFENRYSIKRKIRNKGVEATPNVIFIGLESMNARFMERFGNSKNWTPFLDSLFQKSIAYTNLYAVGTRTVRGLEAITLAIPPTPGRSIVKRTLDSPFFTIGSVFKEKGYSRTFFYGGDGFFDNMNNYFGNSGFDIVDRRKKHRSSQKTQTKRTNISDKEMTFENAWGVCDEDIYNKLLKESEVQHRSGKPFFNFVMNNSNHQPYTYPSGLTDIPSGSSREGAVKYADAALKNFFDKAKDRPWFSNTVFVIMSDHCAYSAGRTEINVKSYHIPAMIYNLPKRANKEVAKLCSQMDVFPTLFGYLNWSYTSNSFGMDIRQTKPEDERAFVANYRRLGLLKKDSLVVLNSENSGTTFHWNQKQNTLTKTSQNKRLYKELIAYYQTAYDLYKNNELTVLQQENTHENNPQKTADEAFQKKGTALRRTP